VLYDHYRQFGRSLPWRSTRDPYAILVSEVMLQQTQVPRVVEKYQEFLRAFPDFAALRQAPFKRVLAVWKGMGYNRRARALQGMADQVLREHGGVLPADEEALIRLPGIGAATAAAICAYAFNKPVVYIETNVRTVFIHFFFRRRDGVTDGELRPLVEQTLDRRNPRRWYSALMDLGVALKRVYGNPSRRSAHHTKQRPFEGSRRQARGLILEALLGRPALTPSQIARRSGLETGRLEEPLKSLEEEGLIAKQGRRFVIP
jgi:A/G-specific adenine glycosylase